MERMEQSGAQRDSLGDITRGTAWVIAARLFIRALGFISTLILARLLVPEDFGLIAIASTIMGGLRLLGAFGFEVWLIRQERLDEDQYNTVWTLGLIRNLVVAIVVIMVAVPVSQFFEDPRLVAVLWVLALSFFTLGLQNVGIVDFQREMTFNREFNLLAATKVGSFIVTVGMAWYLQSYWALLWGIVAGKLLRVIMSYLLHAFRPRLCLRHWREVFGFSKWLLSVSIFSYLYRQAHAPLISKLLGGHSLGLYTVSSEVANMASTELLAPLRRVLLPAYSKMLQDTDELRRSFTETFAIILMLGLPMVVGLWAVAEPLVPLLLGEKWIEAIPLVEILCLFGAASICIANQGPLLIALGKTRFLSGIYALGFVLLVSGALLVTPRHGLIGVAWVMSLVHCLVLVISLPVTMYYLKLAPLKLLGPVWRVAVAALSMGAIVFLIRLQLQEEHRVVVLLASMIPGILVYPALLLLLWRLCRCPAGPESTVLGYLMAKRFQTAA